MLGMTDIHCHILPRVDDGAGSVREARAMLHREYEDGVRVIIATPHYREGMFEPSAKKILNAYIRMRRLAEKELRDCAFIWGASIMRETGWWKI